MTYLYVAVGGALGACARYLVGGLIQRIASPFFPWGTFGVNLLGCLAFGLMAGVADDRAAIGPTTRALVMIGLLGGFTTFSTFTFESFQLLRDGELGRAAFNIAGQVLFGLAGLWVGFSLGRA